jgi:transposase
MKKNQKYNSDKMFPVIERWQESTQSQHKFCKEQNLSISTFQYWLKKYRKQSEDVEIRKQAESNISHQRFLSLEVSEVGRIDTTESFTISYPNGVQLSCSSTTNTQTLRNLINL